MEKSGEFFELKERGTSIKIEVLADIITFMTMTYVLVVQPGAIVGSEDTVSLTNINELVIAKKAIAVTCAIISMLITLFMGFCANLPFALATGMGANFMFSTLLRSNTLSFGAIVVTTLISSLIFVIPTVFGIGDSVIKAIPKSTEVAIGLAIGFYIVYLGFRNSGTGAFTNEVGMGNFKEPTVFTALLSLIIIAVLTVYRASGAILIGIVAVTVMGIPLGVITLPDTFARIPDVSPRGNVVFCFDFRGLLSLQAIIYVFITFCKDFFSTLGTMLGVTGKAGILDEDGNMPGIQKPFLVDAIDTRVEACTSNITVITFVESTSDAEADGRTGLASIMVAVLSAVMVFFSSLILTIPDAATGPAFIFVGFLMVSGIRDIDFSDLTEAFDPFVMIMFIIFCGSTATGIAADILACTIIKTAAGKFKELHPIIYVLAVPLVMYFVFK